MSIVSAIREMMERGLSAEQALVAAEIIEATEKARKDIERQKTAERVRRFRERKKLVTNVTVTDVTDVTAEIGTAPLSKEESKKEKKRERQPQDRGTRLDADWVPSAALVAYGAQHGLSAAQFDREVLKFRNYWIAKSGKDGLKRDWDATFQNWILRATERLPQPSKVVTSINTPTTNAVFVERGSAAWAAWTKHRGKEPIAGHHGGKEGQWMPSEFPPTEAAA